MTGSLPHHHSDEHNLESLCGQLSRIEDFQLVAEVFKQLGDTARVRIFWLLCHCQECVINISAMMGMSSPAVSHHLRPLRNRGLIVSRRIGKEVYYKAADTEQSRMLHHMIEKVMEITSEVRMEPSLASMVRRIPLFVLLSSFFPAESSASGSISPSMVP